MCKKIGKWQDGVAVYMEREGRTLAWMSMVAGISYTYLSKCMKGNCKPSVGLLERLELVMHVPPRSLTHLAYNTGDYKLDRAMFVPEDPET